MDLGHWGFRRWPFERTYAADRFYCGAAHEEALARVLFLVEESRRVGILAGRGGTGKSFLLKQLRLRAERMARLVVVCDAQGLERHELIHQITEGCQVPCHPDDSPARTWNSLRTRFEGLSLIQQRLVVLIDHFDRAARECQHAICRLVQLADSTGVKLTIVLAVRDASATSNLDEIIELRIDVVPWTSDETSQFIADCLETAGSTEAVFSDDAVNAIYETTRGVPSQIIGACHLSLLAAIAMNEPLVTREIVEGVACEMSGSVHGIKNQTPVTAPT